MRQLAERLPFLRKGAMLNQADLGDRMHARRSDWSRSTVVKIENGKRRSISVGELLDLAHVLGVPPAVLIADPRYPDAVPLGLIRDPATGEERPAEEMPVWDALLWVMGASVRREADGPAVSDVATQLVNAGRQLKELVLELGGWADELPRGLAALKSAEIARLYSPTELPLIQRLQRHLETIAGIGASLPVLPDWLYDKAREAGVTLPGDKG